MSEPDVLRTGTWLPSGLRARLARNRLQTALVLVVLVTALVRLPFTLMSDMRGMRADARLSPSALADARGPDAAAGTDLALIHAARARIPRRATFAIVRAGRWGTARHPNRSVAFIYEAGEAWTQFDLAPRVEVAPRAARWMLVLDGTPAGAGLRHPLHQWRYHHDWLVEMRT